MYYYGRACLPWQDAIWTKINLRNDRQSYQDGLFRMDLPTFDEVPVREALLNAVTHRDYRHLRGQGATGSPLSELRQVLPSESESGIQRLLDELRSEGRVALRGQKRWARWVIAAAKAQNP